MEPPRLISHPCDPILVADTRAIPGGGATRYDVPVDVARRDEVERLRESVGMPGSNLTRAESARSPKCMKLQADGLADAAPSTAPT